MLKLLRSDDLIKHMNDGGAWATRHNLPIGHIPKSELIDNLDKVIDINYNKTEISEYEMKEVFTPFARSIQDKKQFYMVTSRGCPFKCAFCMNSVNDDKHVRYASVDKLIDHVEYLVNEFGMNVLTFYDDQILFNKPRAKELFRRLKPFNLRIECPNGLSVAYMDPEIIQLKAEAGVDTVHLAIESGSPYVLQELIHKPLKLNQVYPVVSELRRYNIWVQGYFVVGMPGENDNHRRETVEFIKTVGLDWAIIQTASPVRGSKLYNVCMEKGYIPSGIKMGEYDMTKYIIDTPDYTSEYVAEQAYLMNLEVNFIHNHRIKVKDYLVAGKRFADMVTRFPQHALSHYCLYRIQSDPDNPYRDVSLAHACLENTKRIVSSDQTWKQYFDHFNISM